jgi:hypothetical protein
MFSSHAVQWNVYLLFLKGPRKNDECGKTIVVGRLFIWALYRDQRKWTILIWKHCMWQRWVEFSLYSVFLFIQPFCIQFLNCGCMFDTDIVKGEMCRRSITIVCKGHFLCVWCRLMFFTWPGSLVAVALKTKKVQFYICLKSFIKARSG